jgi:hypothetical protein
VPSLAARTKGESEKGKKESSLFSAFSPTCKTAEARFTLPEMLVRAPRDWTTSAVEERRKAEGGRNRSTMFSPRIKNGKQRRRLERASGRDESEWRDEAGRRGRKAKKAALLSERKAKSAVRNRGRKEVVHTTPVRRLYARAASPT